MAKKALVIVESPSKAKTINQYLGVGYTVVSTMGHIRDLPLNNYGIDIMEDGTFVPKYRIMKGRQKQVQILKQAAAAASEIYLAADPDREGEAICWHVKSILSQINSNIKRIEFNEITKSAVTSALGKAREIDISLVNAQQARRILDRMVGYELSPILWRKIKRGLSAGRVQSVALKLIVDREKEIQAFKPEEYWLIKVKFIYEGSEIYTQLLMPKVNSEDTAQDVIKRLKGNKFYVTKVTSGRRAASSPPPLITSTLQQEASKRFGFSSKRTMRAAQRLYEGVPVNDSGVTKGVITYMRTDSTRVSRDAIEAVRKLIKEDIGGKYLSEKVRYFRKKSAQDAHEAIRPTDVSIKPSSMAKYLGADENKIYSLIYNRFLMHQMSNALFITRKIIIEGGDLRFEAAGEENIFPGFLKLAKVPKSTIPPDIDKGSLVNVSDIDAKKNYTKPPARYKEHSLIKELESQGIGRPSTYATILSTIQYRKYVEKKKGIYFPTRIGTVVSDFLGQWFKDIINEKFTSQMEGLLDDIAAGKQEWQDMLKNFYNRLTPLVEDAKKKSERVRNITFARETVILCDKCGANMVLREGRYGYFLACSRFPECRNIKKVKVTGDNIEVVESKVVQTDITCPKCGKGKLIERHNKKGEAFYGCSLFPKCRFTMPKSEERRKCQNCGFDLLYYDRKQNDWVCPKCGKRVKHND